MATGKAGSGWATISGRACGHRTAGTGRSARACRWSSVISGLHFRKDTWTWEIRPIIDKQIGRWYFTVNPAFERSFHGPSVPQGVGFAPDAKFSYDFNKYISGGLEYYSDYGSLHDIYSFHNQWQQFFPSIDLNVSPQWEINFGVGVGVTAATDHWVVKGIVGRRFDWTHHRPGGSESM